MWLSDHLELHILIKPSAINILALEPSNFAILTNYNNNQTLSY